jgi:hemin uptake protein HemP
MASDQPPDCSIARAPAAVAGEACTHATGVRQGRNTVPDCLHSDTLLKGQSSVSMQHNGAVYRLQATKLGKLILTK